MDEASATNATTTNEAITTDRSKGSSTASMDSLALLGALAKSLLKGNTAWELSIIAFVVVDEEHFRFDGGGGNFDDFLVEGIGTSVENVDESLLLGGRNNNGVGTTDAVLGADEHVVEVNLGVRNVPWRKNLDCLLRGTVEVQVPGNLESKKKNDCYGKSSDPYITLSLENKKFHVYIILFMIIVMF